MSELSSDPYKTPQTPAADRSADPLRRPWLASLLNFVFPGLGYLYLGWWKVAIALLPWTLLLTFVVGRSGAIFLLHGEIVTMVLGVLVPVGTAVHAWLAASRARPAPRLPCQRAHWYVAFAVLSVGLTWAGSFYRGAVAGYEVFSIGSSSMAPTLLPGDRFVVDTTAYRDRVPERGDIVVFRYPADPANQYIMRVVGLPGDTVNVRGRQVLVNGVPIPSRELGQWSAPGGIAGLTRMDLVGQTLGTVKHRVLHLPGAPERNIRVVTAGVNELYVLGDNRDNSNDSRYWGMLPVDHLVGRLRVPGRDDKRELRD